MKWSADPRLMRDPVHLFAFGFGAGLSPVAPGTFGTLIAVPIVIFLQQFGFVAHVVVGFVASRGLARWIASGFIARAVTFVGGC